MNSRRLIDPPEGNASPKEPGTFVAGRRVIGLCSRAIGKPRLSPTKKPRDVARGSTCVELN